jgi:hypothetical protein
MRSAQWLLAELAARPPRPCWSPRGPPCLERPASNGIAGTETPAPVPHLLTRPPLDGASEADGDPPARHKVRAQQMGRRSSMQALSRLSLPLPHTLSRSNRCCLLEPSKLCRSNRTMIDIVDMIDMLNGFPFM